MTDDLLTEYRQAVDREQRIRATAFLPVTEAIGGFEVLPMTLAHFIALRLIGSPFIAGGLPTADDIAAFLWLLSPAYSPHNKAAKAAVEEGCKQFALPDLPRVHFSWSMRRWASKAETALACYEAITKEIRAFVDEALLDRPPTSNEEGPSYFSDAAAICHEFAAAYGWSIAKTLNAPLKQLFQMLKILSAEQRAKAGRAPLMFNPSDAVRGRWLETLNRN